jgi:hypothetical protein
MIAIRRGFFDDAVLYALFGVERILEKNEGLKVLRWDADEA